MNEIKDAMTLAYIGDAVYEVYVRRYVIQKGQMQPDVLHSMSVGYVKASAQAMAVKEIFGELSEEEQRLVKRARNHKTSSRPKNADPVEYKWATAFEALIGHLYMAGAKKRLCEIIEKSISAIETNL